MPEHNLIFISGPPKYLEVIKNVADQLEQSARDKASVEIDVEVFPLRYAWADDQVFFIGTNEVAVPGVATILMQKFVFKVRRYW